MLIAFKLKIALACVAGFAGPLAVAPRVSDLSPRNTVDTAASIVELAPATNSYRVAGDFTHNGKPAKAPLKALRFTKPFAIMRHQVSAADYQLCVRDGGCDALDRNVVVATDRPAAMFGNGPRHVSSVTSSTTLARQ